MFAALPKDFPIGGRAFRQRVFAGTIFKAQCEGGAAPARLTRDWLTRHFGPVEELAQKWRASDWAQVSKVQRAFREDHVVQRAVHSFVQAMAPDAQVLIDKPRLRVVLPDGHQVPRAAPAYLPHRDTWFANSEAQLNWWMPLVPISEATSFGFCPEYFAQAVDNNSASFDYQQWMASGGFQRGRENQREYPTTTLPLEPERFACRLDEYLVFSAAQLHQTLPIEGPRARISLDFRTVWSADREAHRSAPNVDNHSTGDATADYAQL